MSQEVQSCALESSISGKKFFLFHNAVKSFCGNYYY